MLVTLNEILKKAREEHYAVPAFDCTEDVLIRTILDTAEEKKSPVILMVLEHDLAGKGIKYITSMIKGVANEYKIPIALHLDHATNFEIIEKAIENGFTSVMYDGSMLSFDENVVNTKKVVDMAKKKGVSVEAELGHVAGKEIDGTSAGETMLTDADEVVKFVSLTGIDALAVSIGTSHGVYVSTPELKIDRLIEINKLSSVPLVLHGGSGTPLDQVQNAIKNGITKVNLYADLRIALMEGIKKAAEVQKRIDPLPDELFKPTKEILKNKIVEKIDMVMSENRA
ncbi:class II fructose-bisphosphate aldolase [Clostridium drakei]|uniref:Ketose-bisphosphate aldolase n=1 Tax=Clostridium drakei TaxID=332101 RepID=A0A2U8DVR9_9CLOT|nr:class II fructose-bisphosphate aldolase [Clostridium drakei]AWI06877.1 ketose-bisphosphate aldolase [Clostridium drakei]